MKRPYLCVNDYGSGGIWLYIDAESSAAITQKYPELEVFEEPPEFITADLLRQISSELRFDIDAPPHGFLRDLIAARQST